MKNKNIAEERYLGTDYINNNPTWDVEDSPWKADLVRGVLDKHNIKPNSITEVGCGAGAVLHELASSFPNATFCGFDIAPAAMTFWEKYKQKNTSFILGDYFMNKEGRYDLILLLDVLEHLPDPIGFLEKIKGDADYFIIHFPLDLSALSVLRESPLLYVRSKVGHLHYYTKRLALALLDDCGFEVVDCQYTGAAFSAPQRGLKTRLAGLFRRLAYLFGKDAGVRLLGGETLMVLARYKK